MITFSINTYNSRQATIKNLGFKNAKYDNSSRGIKEFTEEKIYPPEFMDASKLQGQRILDLGTGGGRFVRDLRKDGVDIIGLDTRYYPSHNENPEWFINKDIRNANLPENSFDIIYSAYSVFTYNDEDYQTQFEIMKEMTKILKPGGKIRLGLVDLLLVKKLTEDPNITAKLKITRHGENELDPRYKSWTEITKIK